MDSKETIIKEAYLTDTKEKKQWKIKAGDYYKEKYKDLWNEAREEAQKHLDSMVGGGEKGYCYRNKVRGRFPSETAQKVETERRFREKLKVKFPNDYEDYMTHIKAIRSNA